MAHKSIWSSVLLFMAVFTVSAQQPLKWGKYEDYEINLETVPYEPEASAVILGEVGNIFFDNHVNFHLHRRIKVLKSSGKDRVNSESVRFYNNDLAKVHSVRAQVRTPSGEIIRLNSDQILKTRLDSETSRISFAFPDVQVGSIVEYEFTYQYDAFYYIPRWYFQKDIPVLFSMLDARMPGGIGYRVSMQGERLRKKYAQRELGVWSLIDLPSLSNIDNVYNIYKYSEAVSFYLDSSESTEFNSAADIFRKYYLHEYYRSWLDDRHISKLPGAGQLQGTTELETIQNIYRFVQSNFTWNGEHEFHVEESNLGVVERRSGSSGEINLIMRTLLAKYNIPAEVVLISTREHGFPDENIPSFTQFNHLILLVKLGNGIFLDATEPYYDFLTLPPKDQNFKGLVFNKDEPRWVDISPNLSKLTFNYDYNVEANVLQARVSATAHDAAAIRRIADRNEKEVGESLLPGSFEADTVSLELSENYRQPVRISAELHQPDKEAGGVRFIYLPAQLFKFYAEVPYRDESREFPVELSYPFYRQMIGTIRIPPGYKVDELPDPVTVELPAGLGHYRYDAGVTGNVIQVNATLEIPALIVLPEYYQAFRKMIETVVMKQEEMIVLEKKEG